MCPSRLHDKYNASENMLCLQHDSEGSRSTIYSSLITFIETVKQFSSCSSWSAWSSASRSLASRRSTWEVGKTSPHDHRGSRTFRSVFIHPCCISSSYSFVISLLQSNPMNHMLDVWLRSRLVRGRRDRSTTDLEMSFLSFPTILWDSLTWTAFTNM